MSPQTLFVLTVATCLVNGLTSPLLGLVFALWPLWYPPVVTPVAELVFYGASLIVATATLLASAVPAAVVDRSGASPAATNAAWLGGAATLTLMGLVARA
jgi:hypothetical protein